MSNDGYLLPAGRTSAVFEFAGKYPVIQTLDEDFAAGRAVRILIRMPGNIPHIRVLNPAVFCHPVRLFESDYFCARFFKFVSRLVAGEVQWNLRVDLRAPLDNPVKRGLAVVDAGYDQIHHLDSIPSLFTSLIFLQTISESAAQYRLYTSLFPLISIFMASMPASFSMRSASGIM